MSVRSFIPKSQLSLKTQNTILNVRRAEFGLVAGAISAGLVSENGTLFPLPLKTFLRGSERESSYTGRIHRTLDVGAKLRTDRMASEANNGRNSSPNSDLKLRTESPKANWPWVPMGWGEGFCPNGFRLDGAGRGRDSLRIKFGDSLRDSLGIRGCTQN